MPDSPHPRRVAILTAAVLGGTLGILISALLFASGPGFEATHLIAAVPGGAVGAGLARSRARRSGLPPSP